jgi:hypothetical protein
MLRACRGYYDPAAYESLVALVGGLGLAAFAIGLIPVAAGVFVELCAKAPGPSLRR